MTRQEVIDRLEYHVNITDYDKDDDLLIALQSAIRDLKMLDEKIKPCPFCGKTPMVEECDSEYFIRCKCGIEQTHLYRQKCDAIRHWNRRS